MRRRPGAAALLIACLTVLASQFASVAHMVIVEHVRCVHGELVHTTDGHTEARTGIVEAVDAVEVVSTEDAHAHCDWCAHQVAGLPPLDGPVLVGLLDWLPLSQVIRPATEHTPLPTLAVAPKQSPPQS